MNRKYVPIRKHLAKSSDLLLIKGVVFCRVSS